jgi:hypothetical protein
MLKDLGYMYVRVMAQYQEQPCDVVITGRYTDGTLDGIPVKRLEAFQPIYVECKSTKHDRIALSRNKRLREQYLTFFTLCEGRGFYAVRFGDGTVSFMCPPFKSLTLRRANGAHDLGFLEAWTPRSPNNPLYVPQERTEMQEPEDRTL